MPGNEAVASARPSRWRELALVIDGVDA